MHVRELQNILYYKFISIESSRGFIPNGIEGRERNGKFPFQHNGYSKVTASNIWLQLSVQHKSFIQRSYSTITPMHLYDKQQVMYCAGLRFECIFDLLCSARVNVLFDKLYTCLTKREGKNKECTVKYLDAWFWTPDVF